MLAKVNGIPVHYSQHAIGTPVLALHGGGVDHREIMGALEPLFADRPGYRRIYPDLPGMGRTRTRGDRQHRRRPRSAAFWGAMLEGGARRGHRAGMAPGPLGLDRRWRPPPDGAPGADTAMKLR